MGGSQLLLIKVWSLQTWIPLWLVWRPYGGVEVASRHLGRNKDAKLKVKSDLKAEKQEKWQTWYKHKTEQREVKGPRERKDPHHQTQSSP